jgi:hypothetical protein
VICSERGETGVWAMAWGCRREMLNLERYIVERDLGPLDFEPWAGSISWMVP